MAEFWWRSWVFDLPPNFWIHAYSNILNLKNVHNAIKDDFPRASSRYVCWPLPRTLQTLSNLLAVFCFLWNSSCAREILLASSCAAAIAPIWCVWVAAATLTRMLGKLRLNAVSWSRMSEMFLPMGVGIFFSSMFHTNLLVLPATSNVAATRKKSMTAFSSTSLPSTRIKGNIVLQK